MTSVVDNKCIKCMSCTEVCPVDAFREDEKMLVVDPDTCIDCGVCIPECPETAIALDSDADAEWISYNADKAPSLPEAKK